MQTKGLKEIKVAKRTNPHLLADAICGVFKQKQNQNQTILLKAVGAYPTNQALKAVAYVAEKLGNKVSVQPYMIEEDDSSVMCIEIIWS